MSKYLRAGARSWALASASLCLFALAGCDGGTTSPEPEPEAGRPKLVVLTPQTGATVDGPSEALTFRVEDADATAYSVAIGGGAPVRVEGALSADVEQDTTVALVPGVNTIRLAVYDDVGEADAETVVLIVPEVEQPPVIRPIVTVTSPMNGVVVHDADITLSFEVGLAAASGYRVVVGSAAPIEVAEAVAAGSSRDVALSLVDGVNTVTVSVLDASGVADVEELVIVVDLVPAPVVAFTSPADQTLVHDAAITVRGTITTTQTLSSSTITVNGSASSLAVVAASGGYTFEAEVDLEVGANEVVVAATDALGESGDATLGIARELDEIDPTIALVFPRPGQAVRASRVLVRGTVADASALDRVWLESAGEEIEAELDEAGTFRAFLDLVPASNAYEVHARDVWGNEAELASTTYFGQQLGAGGAFSGFLRGGQIFTTGRNNLGQTGLDYVSHESRTTWCERALVNPNDQRLCKAVTVATMNDVCLNPGLVSPAPADSPEAVACRAATLVARDAICDAAGTAAPANCKTSTGVSMSTICETAYGVGTPLSRSCKSNFTCNAAYAAGTPERDACVALSGSVPITFPTPATPYAPTRITAFSTNATPAALPAQTVPFSALGTTFVSISFNQNAASALDAQGRVWGWGDGANGMLGLGDAITDEDANDRRIPHRLADFGAPGTTAVAIARGYDHLLILRSDGTVYACGVNTLGQIGDGTYGAANNRALPTQVLGLPADVIQVVASAASSYAVTASGSVYAWGRNQYANLGNGTTSTQTAASPVPALVPGLTDVVSIATGRDHVIVARADGSVYGWGLNASKQVAGTAANVVSPVRIADVTDAVAVYANGNQGFYLDSLGRLFGWGQNGSGNLGIPEDADQPAPTIPVFGLSNVTDIGIGPLHGLAIRGSSTFSWGWSFHGSLGGGTSTIHTWAYRTPILVTFPPN